MLTVDMNCDLGESFGTYQLGRDEEILRWITSANIACGFHAGDPSIMRKTVRLCMEHHVAIGAHPGLPDLIGFGRRNMAVTPDEAYDMVVYQIGALDAFVKSEGGQLKHVKPHGALYNMAAKDKALARSIAEAIYKVNPELILYGLSGSQMIEEGESIGLRCANEAFVDRTYVKDGTLTPRTEANAVITDLTQAANQALELVKKQSVKASSGETIKIKTDTICIHGDGPLALAYAQHIHDALKLEGIQIQSIT